MIMSCIPTNLLGKTFGNLYVKEMRPSVPNGPNATAKTWICDCKCGNQTQVLSQNLIKGRTKSCGCGVNPIKFLGAEASCRELYKDYQIGAKQRGFLFQLTLDEFRTLTSGDCVYCGAKPTRHARARKGTKIAYIYNGVDRIDNGFGYTKENSASCCWVCNRMKFKVSAEDFLEHARRITEHSA